MERTVFLEAAMDEGFGGQIDERRLQRRFMHSRSIDHDGGMLHVQSVREGTVHHGCPRGVNADRDLGSPGAIQHCMC